MENDFLYQSHYIAKAMKDTEYPTNKGKLLEAFGEVDIPVNPTHTIKFKKILERLDEVEIKSAAQFYSMLYAKKK